MLWNVMAILLLLLKIVGILLLILLLLVVLILFVPLRYRVCTTFYEEKRVRGRVSWLCFVVRAVFLWEEGETRLKLRIFGIPVLSGNGNGISSSFFRKKGRKKGNKKREAAKNKQKVVPDKSKTQNTQKHTSEGAKTESKPTEDKVDRHSESSHLPTVQSAPKSKKHRGLLAWIKNLWERIKNFFHTLKKLFRLFRQKVHSLRDLADLLREEETRYSICIVKDNMIHLWKQIHPRKIRGDIVFGTGDPCTTGQALGGIAVLYGWIGSGVHIVPDFQEKRLEGKLDVIGRIRIIALIVIMVKMMFHKDFKQLWQKLEQWKEDF